MRKLNKIFLYLIILSLLCASKSFAQELASKELIENAKIYDGQAVVYIGEAIGDIMQRGNFVWINVKDEYAAIGIWLPKKLADEIVYTGSYKDKGDILEIEGTFNRACGQHGGELDIHATSIKKLVEGSEIKRELSPQKQKIAFLVLGLALCLGILQTLRMRR
ncbi:MAG: DNA-binding protein [Candidatus Omnitrophota bacterium]